MVLFSFSVFFQKYSQLLKEKKILKELTHNALECKRENLTMEGKINVPTIYLLTILCKYPLSIFLKRITGRSY